MAVYPVSLDKKKFEYEGPFLFQEFYKKLFEVLEKHEIKHPDLVIKEFSEKIENERRKISISLEGSKKVNDYAKANINISINVELERIKRENLDIDWGKITIEWGPIMLDIDEEKRVEALSKVLKSLAPVFKIFSLSFIKPFTSPSSKYSKYILPKASSI